MEQILGREGLRSFTGHTITDRSLLAKELESIRQRGFALDDEEHEMGGFTKGSLRKTLICTL